MSRVLVDSSVWVAHFRQSNATLEAMMAMDGVLSHPVVLGEVACGTPPDRANTLALIADLAQAVQASMRETIAMIERHDFKGRGCGIADMLLLASTLMTPEARIWTLDKRLATLATEMGVRYEPPVRLN